MPALFAGFFGLLRPKELFEVLRCDVRLPGPRSLLGAPVAVLTIREPKNRAFAGRLQVRTIRDQEALGWISWWLKGAGSKSPVWLFGPAMFRRCLETGLKYFELDHLKLTAASLRAGGATHMMEMGIPVAQIKFAGSWSSEKVLSHYLQVAEGSAAILDIPQSASDRITSFLADFSFVAGPPAPSAEMVVKEWTSTRLDGWFRPRAT